jgi:DNA mismatch endonuclease (patch repair protein)
MDTMSQAQRSERMSRIRAKDTEPELRVRSLVHRMGYRFRLHGAKLPGKPDMVFPSRRKVIFIHGCFWHRHPAQCTLARLPKSRMEFWGPKLEANRLRDQRNRRALTKLGWKSLVIWECQLAKMDQVAAKIAKFLE